MMRDVKTAISRGMKVRMFELDMTEKELAKRSGVPNRSISNYVTRKSTMKADALAAIAEALGVSADWLLGLEDKRAQR